MSCLIFSFSVCMPDCFGDLMNVFGNLVYFYVDMHLFSMKIESHEAK